MGVSTDVWRQRIGMFRMPPSKCAKMAPCKNEAEFSPTSISFGLGTITFLTTMIAVAIGSVALPLVFTHFDHLPSCGDVELNPGPTPLLNEDLLGKLADGDYSFEPPPFDLKNKHLYQLLLQRQASNTSWSIFMKWLEALLPSFQPDPSDIKRLSKAFNVFLKKRQSLNKSKSRSPLAFEEWEECDMQLSSRDPTLPHPRQPEVVDMQVVIEENNKLKQDIKELTQINDKFKQDNKELTQINDKLKQDNKELTQDNEQLKTKNQELKQEIETLESNKTTTPKQNSNRREMYHRKSASKLKAQIRSLESELETSGKKCKRLGKALKVAKRDLEKKNKEATEFESNANTVVKSLTDVFDADEKNAEKMKEVLEHNAKLQSKLDEPDKVNLMQPNDQGKLTYTDNVRTCIYKLLNYNISFKVVGAIIETVLNMLGKKADHLPSASTISNMNKERLGLAQCQLKELTREENMTIGTDETPKAGDIYMTYTVNVDSGDSYILGLRDMLSKSAEDTLQTFKLILDDISDICNEITPGNHDEQIGLEILCKIKNTMSDRAATEGLFNEKLEHFRKECLPLYNQGWDKFTEGAKSKLIEMNNFYCGLHLLVSMAETIATSFKEFENVYLDGENVGAPSVLGRVFSFSANESGTVRTVRTACKALAKGADEKSGCFRHWKTYLKQQNIVKSYLQNFHGNRFNIVFLLGGCVYHIHDHIRNFLNNVHGTTNGLLKAVAADISVPVYLAGCKVLGLLNKFITAPLWRVTEKPGHILDMCEYYTRLGLFFKLCIDNESKLEAFVRGELSCFDESLMTKDEVYMSLVQEGEHDRIVRSMMHHTFLALHQLVIRVTKEFQPGGQYHTLQHDLQFKNQTLSTPKHNKLPERIFGYLDFLINRRPNVSSITNEAQVMFLFNHTHDYIEKLPKSALKELIAHMRGKGRKDLITKYKQREEKRQHQLIKKQQEKQAALEKQRQNELHRKEELTSTIIDAGLWQSQEHCDTKMAACTCESERYTALKKQIQFRRKLLCQYLPDDKKFTFTYKDDTTGKYKNRPSQELKAHLMKFITAAKSVSEGQSVERTVDHEIISTPLLTGKTVLHFYEDDDDPTQKKPWQGLVVSQVPGFPDWYNIKYDDDPAVYSCQLVQDYKDGNLEIVPNV